MSSTVVGLIGRKRSGKDTFARRLVEEHGYTRFAFADQLKAAALELDPIIEGELGKSYDYGYGGEVFESPEISHYVRLSQVVEAQGWEAAKAHPEVRRTLQRIGVAARNVDPLIWVRPVVSAIREHSGPVVVTDVRFPNELGELFYQCGATFVRIVRPDVAEDDASLHISETALDDEEVDLTVTNDRSIAELYAAADTLAMTLRAGRL